MPCLLHTGHYIMIKLSVHLYLSTCPNRMSASVHVDLARKICCFLRQNLQVLIGCCISRLEYLQLSLEAFYKTAGVQLQQIVLVIWIDFWQLVMMFPEIEKLFSTLHAGFTLLECWRGNHISSSSTETVFVSCVYFLICIFYTGVQVFSLTVVVRFEISSSRSKILRN